MHFIQISNIIVFVYILKNLLPGFPSPCPMKIIQRKDSLKFNRCAHLSVSFSSQILATHNNIHMRYVIYII